MNRYEMFAHEVGQVTAEEAKHGRWVMYAEYEADKSATRARLEALAKGWKKEARDAVPPEYAARAMHYKYLKGDNYAAGQDDCAAELLAALNEAGREPEKEK